MGLEARGDLLEAVYDGLRELGQDPATVQVALLTDAGGSTLIQLHNAEGCFLEALPIPPEDPVEEDHTEEPPRTDYSGVEALQAALKNAEQKQEELARSLEHCRSRLSEVWRNSCEQARMLDSEVGRRGDKIAFLKARVADLEQKLHLAWTPSSADRTLESSTPDHGSSSHVLPDPPPSTVPASTRSRVGKAPPIDSFSGDSHEVLFDDWLPSLERAATWNGWTEEEKLLQLAGYLKGRAFQEWQLIDDVEKRTFDLAVKSSHLHLDPGSKAMAAQDFRHLAQKEKELVAEFIRRLERAFQVAYGRDRMSTETRDTLLHGQLQEGL